MSRQKTHHTKQFKLDAIDYRKEHPDLTQVECAKNLGICQKLFSIFWQTITAIFKAWIIIMTANSWIKTYTINDSFSVKVLHFGISI